MFGCEGTLEDSVINTIDGLSEQERTYFAGRMNYLPINTNPRPKKKRGTLFYSNAIIKIYNGEFPQNEQVVIDDFKKHIEVLKRILKDDDEIIPFDKIEAPQSEIL